MTSKNNPDNRNKQNGKMVLSSDCEKCEEKCTNGKRYLKLFESKRVGRGIYCIRGGNS